MKTRTESDWQKVYNVLVAIAGATEHYRQSFIDTCLAGELTEWRFQGHLGFGGKIWLRRHTDELYVSCYPEQSTAKRRRIIAKVNSLLKEL